METFCNCTGHNFHIETSGFVTVIILSLGTLLILCVGVFTNGLRKNTLPANDFNYLKISIITGLLLQPSAIIFAAGILLENFQNALNNSLLVSILLRASLSVISVGYSLVFGSILIDTWRRSENSLCRKLRTEHLLTILGIIVIVEILVLSFWIVSFGSRHKTVPQETWCWVAQSSGCRVILSLDFEEKHWVSGFLLYKVVMTTAPVFQSMASRKAVRNASGHDKMRTLVPLSSITLAGIACCLPVILFSATTNLFFVGASLLVLMSNLFGVVAYFPITFCRKEESDILSSDKTMRISVPDSNDTKLLLLLENKRLTKANAENKRIIQTLKSRLRAPPVTTREWKTSSNTFRFVRSEHSEQDIWVTSNLHKRRCVSDTMLLKTRETTTQDKGYFDSKTELSETVFKIPRRHEVIDCGAGCYYVTDDDTTTDSESEWEPLGGSGALRFQKHVKIIESVYRNGFLERGAHAPRTRCTKTSPKVPTSFVWPDWNFTADNDCYSYDSDSSYDSYDQNIGLLPLRKSETLV